MSFREVPQTHSSLKLLKEPLRHLPPLIEDKNTIALKHNQVFLGTVRSNHDNILLLHLDL
jgi:hypothetical protein